MSLLPTLLFLAALLYCTMVQAQDVQERFHDPKSKDEKDHFRPNDHFFGGGYRSYGRRPSYGYSGYGRRGFGSYGHDPFIKEDKPLDEVDKLYSRLEGVLSQLKAYSEQLDAQAAQLSLQKKKLDQLKLVKLPALQEEDDRQQAALDDLSADALDVAAELSNKLLPALQDLASATSANAALQMDVSNSFDTTRQMNIAQQGEIDKLRADVTDLKGKILQVIANELKEIDDRLEDETDLLTSVKGKENSRMCETGKVTLDTVDRKAEYQYQSSFQVVPQVHFGLCGFNFDLDTLDDDHKSHDGYGYRPKEPEAIGARANAFSSKTGLTVELFDLGFGDSSVVSVDVCFQVCSILPSSQERPFFAY